MTGDDFSGLRRHENADIEVKLPVVIEGDTPVDKEWTAWTAGLALADRGETLLDVKSDRAQRSTGITLGPWEVYTIDRG